MSGGDILSGGRRSSVWWRELNCLEKDSFGFRNLWFSNAIQREVGNGHNTLFCKDPWIEGSTLDL